MRHIKALLYFFLWYVCIFLCNRENQPRTYPYLFKLFVSLLYVRIVQNLWLTELYKQIKNSNSSSVAYLVNRSFRLLAVYRFSLWGQPCCLPSCRSPRGVKFYSFKTVAKSEILVKMRLRITSVENFNKRPFCSCSKLHVNISHRRWKTSTQVNAKNILAEFSGEVSSNWVNVHGF